jgi:hypothetical protein
MIHGNAVARTLPNKENQMTETRARSAGHRSLRHHGTWRALVLGAVLMMLDGTAALGQERAPDNWFSGEALIEFHNDWSPSSDDASNERNDMYVKVQTALEARLTPRLKAASVFVYEPVRSPAAGRDRTFENEGLYVQELFLTYADERFGLRGGKSGQKFGIAWAAAPGIWGTDFAEDYEISEQVGVAGDIRFAATGGKHTFTIGTFFADTTILSESALTNRGRTRKSAGGAGNTGDFSSYTVTLEGKDFSAVPGLIYHLSHMSRGADGAGETTEKGYAAGLQYTFTAGAVEIAALVEGVHFSDRSGTAGSDADYLTTAVGASWKKWNLALSRTTCGKARRW